jgi:hypothetical protein
MVTELAVDEWFKPHLDRRMRRSRLPTSRLKASKSGGSGHTLFLQIDVDPAALPNWQFRDRTVKKVKRAVPASRTIECPYGPA